MRASRLLATLAVGAALAAPADAQTYTFDVQYFGGGVASLAPGSDNPVGLALNPGDSFLWTITAMNGDYWRVASANNFFAMMAFPMQESGTRIGSMSFELLRNGASVFSQINPAIENQYVHLGTNSVNLAAGLEWDVMSLSYTLTSAVVDDDIPPPNAGDPTTSTPRAILPIFGPPDENRFYRQIDYVNVSAVPEPATYAMLATGLGLLGVVARRRRGMAA